MKPKFIPGSFTPEARRISTSAELSTALAELAECEGWVEYTSGITAGAWSSGHGAKGFPLSGEWVSKNGQTSWHLRTLDDGWVLTTFTANEAGNDRLVEHSLCSDASSAKSLRYQVLWVATPQGTPQVAVWTPTLSRFCGFGG